MKTYHYTINSNAAPFFSDSDSGFVEGETAMKALKKVVKGYNHPCGLYSAIITSCEPKPKLLARFLSARAVTTEKAGTGVSILKEKGKIFVNGKEVPWEKEDKWENFEEKEKIVFT